MLAHVGWDQYNLSGDEENLESEHFENSGVVSLGQNLHYVNTFVTLLVYDKQIRAEPDT